jgi:RNA polymerase sigma-70 factor (ECF subfamily)
MSVTCRGRNLGFSDDPEAALMMLVKSGDPEAFARLAARHWPHVFARLYRQVRDREEAEDLTQDVFLRVYRYRTRYEPRAKFGTWLFQITQNVARNALRSRRRRPCLPLAAIVGQDETSFLDKLLSHQSESPSRSLEREELACRVRSAVSGLADRQRTALVLHQFEDRSYTEVASRMNMTPKAVKALLYRARIQLRENLGSLEGAET